MALATNHLKPRQFLPIGSIVSAGDWAWIIIGRDTDRIRNRSYTLRSIKNMDQEHQVDPDVLHEAIVEGCVRITPSASGVEFAGV